MATLLYPADAIARARTMNIDDDLMSAEEFFALFSIAAPDRLITRFGKNIDPGAPMIVDAVTLKWLGYTVGTLCNKQQQFIGRLDELNVKYEAIKEATAKKSWPEVATEIAAVDPRHRPELRWVVLPGLDFKLACLKTRRQTAARLVARFFVKVELVFRAYNDYCTRHGERERLNQSRLNEVEHDRDVLQSTRHDERGRQRDDEDNRRDHELLVRLNQSRLNEVEHDRDVLQSTRHDERGRQRDDEDNRRDHELLVRLNQSRLNEVEHDRDALQSQRRAMARRYVSPAADPRKDEAVAIIKMDARYKHVPESDPAYTKGITHVFVRRQTAALKARLEEVRRWGNRSNLFFFLFEIFIDTFK